MELWQTAAQELDRLKQVYQKTVSDGQIHDAQRQQLKVECSHISMHGQHASPSPLDGAIITEMSLIRLASPNA